MTRKKLKEAVLFVLENYEGTNEKLSNLVVDSLENDLEEYLTLRDMLITQTKANNSRIRKLSDMIDHRNAALKSIYDIMLAPARNKQFMQIANPARQAINIVKRFLDPKAV